MVAEFIRGGGDVADQHVLRVIQGADSATESGATDPVLTQDDLAAGGTTRQEALYRLRINGTTLAAVERVADYVGNVYQ